MSHTANTIINATEAHFFPVFTRTELVVQRAQDCRVWDVDGREYIDLTSGWGVTCLGHCPTALTQALTAQLGNCMQTPNCNLSYTQSQADAASRLVEIAPEGLTRVFWLRGY